MSLLGLLFAKICSFCDGVDEKADPSEWNRHYFGLSRDRWQSFAGKSYWVVGAGTGFGRSIAVVLALTAARVVLTGRRLEKLEETVDEAVRLYGVTRDHFIVLPADITDPADLEQAIQRLQDAVPVLHGLVSSAAVSGSSGDGFPLLDGSDQLWNSVMQTNVTSQWLLARSVLLGMLATGRVRVVLMSSGAGWASTPGFGMYNISKAALNSLACSLAAESAARYPDVDVQLNVVDPGEARTEMNQGSNASPYSAVSIILFLLSHPKGGPNGKFFQRNGNRVKFCSSDLYIKRL